MKTLTAPTEEFAKGERGVLSADIDAGSNVVVTLENATGFAAGDFVAIGHEGNELCELAQITDDGNTSFTVASLKFAHHAGDPVRVYRFDKRKFYGATSEAGSYTELTGDGSPKPIEVDDPMGTSLEYSGSTYTYFKATYFNSETSTETDIDDAIAVLGDQSSRYAPLYDIRKTAGLHGNTRYSDRRIEVKRKQAENEINSTLAARYVLPLAEVPALISQICELLAAGYIMYEEFGAESDGGKMLGEARALLKAIASGRQLLLGSDMVELTRVESSGQISGYPDSTDTDAAKFSMGQTF